MAGDDRGISLSELLRLRQPPPQPGPRVPLPQTPLRETNPVIASLRDFLGGVTGLQDAFGAEQPSNATLYGAGLGAMLPLATLMKASKAAKVAKPITAYHGSPHDFDKFSLEKIGTGEGAQAYGHGLYFAENKNVAKEYQRTLARGIDEFDHDKGYGVREPKTGEVKWFANEKDAKEFAVDTGKTYEVAIHATPEEFLDWDAPLSQQSEKVRKAVQEIVSTKDQRGSLGYSHDPSGYSEDLEFRGIMRWQPDPSDVATIEALKARTASADEAYRRVGYRSGPEQAEFNAAYEDFTKFVDAKQQTSGRWAVNPEAKGSELYKSLTALEEKRQIGAEKSTNALNQRGIKGIRYLDQGSRDPAKMKELADDLAQYREAAKHWAATGNQEKLKIATKQVEVLEKRLQQTRNFVVFDDSIIDIMKKYGIALPAAVALKAKLEREQQQRGRTGG